MNDDYANARFEQKPNGYIIVNGKEVAHTRQCPHCGSHFISVRGSGKIRGFCKLCMRVTCGRRPCLTCIPYERKFEMEEKDWQEKKAKREWQAEQRQRQMEEITKRFGNMPIIGNK